MRPGSWSRTAEATAAMRAAHLLLDDDPKVFTDPYAARLLGIDPGLARLFLPRLGPLLRRRLRRSDPPWLRSRWPTGTRRMRAQILVRSRYAEDRLADATRRGVDQVVILAAGLDSFAFRHPDGAAGVRVFEVDHPASQALKRNRLDAVGLDTPAHLVFAPCDFERQSLDEALAATSYAADRPAFFSWLGVTYYLSREAVVSTLAFVSRQAAGSEMVFDYWCSQRLDQPADEALLAAVRLGVATQGEPMHTFFQPEEVARKVEEHGLALLDNLSPAAAQRRYLQGRRDGLRLPTFAWIAHAGKPREG